MLHSIGRYANGGGNSRGLYIKYLREAPVSGSLALALYAEPSCGFSLRFSQLYIATEN